MILEDIYNGLKAETITFQESSHIVNSITTTLGWKLEGLKKTTDTDGNKLKRNVAKYRKRTLNQNYRPGDTIHLIESYCFDCDQTMYLILLDETTLGLIERSMFLDLSDDTLNVKILPEHIEECSFKEQRAKKMLEAEINIPTGELIFKNYFNKTEIYEASNVGRSINAISGRFELMKYLATRDVGYGQMGNMSVSVFLKEDKSEIIIGDGSYTDDTDEEHDTIFEGFEHIGGISLSVWRWMCADRETLKTHDEKTIEQDPSFKENGYATYTEDYQDIVEVKVLPGKWKIEHYFDLDYEREDRIYSKLFLIK